MTDQERYEALMTQVMRTGNWLSGPSAQLLPEVEWQARFADYEDQLNELRALGDKLCPRVSLVSDAGDSSAVFDLFAV